MKATPLTFVTSKPFIGVAVLIFGAALLIQPARAATSDYFGTNNASGTGYDQNGAFWTTSATESGTLSAFALGDAMIIGASAGDFNGSNYTINLDNGGSMSGGAITIGSTNVSITFIGTVNTHFGAATTITVAGGSTLIWDTTRDGSFNFNNEAVTLAGAGTITFDVPIGENETAFWTENMTGGSVTLASTVKQTSTAFVGGYTLTAGTLNFGTAFAMNNDLSGLTSGKLFTIGTGSPTIDNTSGSAGTLALGSATYKINGNFTFVGSSSLNLGNFAVALGASPTITIDANTLTVPATVSGTGDGLTVAGNGTLALTSATTPYTFTGPLTVNAGSTLLMSNYSGSFSLPANQVWNVNGALAAGAITAGTGSSALNMNGGALTVGTVSGVYGAVNLTNATINLATLPATGAALTTSNYNGSGVNTFNIAALPPITNYPANFVLVQATNVMGAGSTVVTLPAATPSFVYSLVTNATGIEIVVSSGPVPARVLTWTGVVPDPGNPNVEDWDLQNTENWTVGGVATFFNNGDEVTFDDSATGTNVSLAITSPPLAPGSMLVTNNSLLYTLSGSGGLAGPATLVKEGTNSLVIANSGANTFAGGILAAGGTVLLQDPNDAIAGNLIATNGGQVILDDTTSPANAITGNTFIFSNSVVEDGNNDGLGILPSGIVSISAGGSLVFNNPNSITIANSISGSGTLIQSNAGGVTQIDAVNNGFNGSVLVDLGTLQFGIAGELNATVPISIANGATLDINGIIGSNTVAAVSGSGIGGNGAIVNNSSTSAFPALSFMTLTGDTVWGGPARWDLRSPAGTSGSPVSCKLTCAGGQPYNITKIGASFVGIVACTVDPNLGNIDVQNGSLDIEGNTTGLGNPSATLSVESPGVLFFFAPTNHLNKNFVLNDGALINQNSGATIVIGPVSLNGTSTGSFIETTGGISVTFSNAMSGAGGVTFETTASSNVPVILAGANSYTGPTAIASGNVHLVGSGSINNSAINIEQGSATLDVSALTIPFSNTNSLLLDGALNLGNTTISAFNSLDLDSGTLTLPLNNPGAPPIVVSNLIVGSTTVNITVLPVTLTPGNYPVISYQGTAPASAPSVSLPVGYTGSLAVNVNNSTIDLQISAVLLDVWNGGGGAGDTDWSDPANWGGNTIGSGSPLYFNGNISLVNTNDTAVDTQYGIISFLPGSGPFVLYGNNIEASSGAAMINSSSNPQTVDLGVDFINNPIIFTGGSTTAAPLILGGGLNDLVSSGVTTNIFNGCGVLTNLFSDLNPVTNLIMLTNNNANWTLADNGSSTTNTLPWGFEVFGGTFNYGTAGDTNGPNFVSTPANAGLGGLDNEIGVGAGQNAVFNMVNGSLTLNARIDTAATTSGSTAIFNQTGGSLTINGQFQGANIGSATSTVNLSGGAFHVVGNTTFVASRGTGSFTVGGTAVVTLGTLDVSRGIGLPTAGVVNLNAGGTLVVNEISTATANAASPVTGASANLNLNGGTLKAGTNSGTFITDSSEGSSFAIPLTVTIQSGGAIINDNGFTISILESLLHDATLGVTNDGGLIKLGAGTVTLGAATGLGGAIADNYTGPTVVSAGTLTLGNAASISSSKTISLTSGADINASSIGTLTLPSGQTLEGTGNITGTLTASSGSIVTPGTPTATGALTVSGAVILGGSTIMKLNAGPASDQVASTLASGVSMTYGGTLTVNNMAGNTLAAGNTFTLFPAASSSSYAGSFSGVSLPALDAGLIWQTNFLNVNGSISVVSSSPSKPNINSVVMLAGNLVFSGTNGSPSGPFYVLTTTNLTLPLTNWTIVSTNSFGPTGNFSVTNPINFSGPPTFFQIEAP